MDAQEIIDKIKSRLEKKRLDDFEIFLARSARLEVEAKGGKVDTLEKSDTSGVSIRLLKGNRIGFSYSTDFQEKSLGEMVDAAVNSSSEIGEDRFNGFPSGGEEDFPCLDIFDEKLVNVLEEEKIVRAKELEEAARSYDHRITKVRSASYSETTSQGYIFNSRGIDLNYRKTIFKSSIMAIAEDGSDSQMGWDMDFHHFYDQLNVKEVGAGAARRATEKLGARKIKTTKCPVILDNVASSEILMVLYPSFLAENLLKGKSLLKDRLEKKVFSPQIGIVDDGLLGGGIATSPFDGEGTARQKTRLVEKGVLRHFLYDHYYSKKDRSSSTGNSSRPSIESPPQLGISNIFIEKGRFSLEDLLVGVERGLLINEFMGVHTANSISGDFSLGASGFWVEGGKISHPVKEVALSGNIIDLLADVEGVGTDLRFFGNIGAPSIRIKEMDISGQ